MTTVDYGHSTSPGADRDALDNQQLQSEAKKEFEKEIMLGDPPHTTYSRLNAKTRIVRASDILLALAGRSPRDTREPSPGVENFQEALRLFPPFRDDDGATLGAVEAKCPDCEAVFTTQNELKQHYLTKYCPGASIAVYVMTRDRLITKGYRMEKRLIPFECRPIRFFCEHCEKQFSVGDEERMDRQRGAPSFVDCKNCGEKCNISYEPLLNDPRDDASLRDVQRDWAGTPHSQSRSPSITPQKGSLGSKMTTTSSHNEQSFAKRAKRIRDSWSFRKISQSDEDELVAISFAGLYDLERVHAPHGVYQQLENGSDFNKIPSDASFVSGAGNDISVVDPRRGLCEDDHEHRNDPTDSEGELLDANDNRGRAPLASRRQSFLQKIFGRKTPKSGVSRSRSASHRGKKLMKRANTLRFSLVGRTSRNENKPENMESVRTSVDSHPADIAEYRQSATPSPVQDVEYVALLRGSQNIFIHLQYLPGGAMIHDGSGRQRILGMEEVAQLFLQLKDELAATSTWSRTLTTRLRAESALKAGNSRAAVVEYQDALKMLENTPALDVDQLTKAAMLHSLGQAFRNLDMPAESEACYLESLGLYKRTHGRDHPKNFAVLHDLGALCEKDGYATEASALYERSFAGRQKTLGNNAPETLSSMQDLASLKVLLGDLESALMLLEKAVPALDTVFGLQNATTLNAMNQLSLLYQKLGLDKESRTICSRTIPHCRTFFGITSPVTRDAVVRYIQSSENFDFPGEIRDILDQYQRSRDSDAMRVIHRLGRSYMDAGLNRDAAELFEALVEDFLAVKGPDAPETFDALSALCVSREHLDSVDKAILAYKQLVHMAKRTPEEHHSRKRIGYAEKRIIELNRRREILAAERKEWALNEPGQCEHCGNATTILCNTCKIFRFCSDKCHTEGLKTHLPNCIPSVSLRESKSLAVKPKCPSSAREQAISKIRHFDSNRSVNITASYTFYLDPRNFTTFRMKLNPNANTIILFSLDSDIQYATIDNPPSLSGSTASPSPVSSTNTDTSASSDTSTRRVKWLTPERQEAVCFIPSTANHQPQSASQTRSPSPLQPQRESQQQQQPKTGSLAPSPNPSKLTKAPPGHIHSARQSPSPSPSPYPPPRKEIPARPKENESRYVLVTPGREMLKSVIDKRVSVRGGGGDQERFRALDMPNSELIEYAQGLLLTGYLGEAFMYVIEWEWK